MVPQKERDTQGFRISALLRVVILSLIAFTLAVGAVSFAVHHMRLGFEREYGQIYSDKIHMIATHASMILDGSIFADDPIEAGVKYAAVMDLMIQQSDENDFSSLDYGIYAYSNGTLYLLHETNPEHLYASTTPISQWLTTELTFYEKYEDMRVTVFVPILDEQGEVRGLLELTGSYDALDQYGQDLENRLLGSVLFVVAFTFIIFSVQYIVPFVLNIVRNNKSRGAEHHE